MFAEFKLYQMDLHFLLTIKFVNIFLQILDLNYQDYRHIALVP